MHQQGEELHMPPYQRRFENRPLETRVFLLDPDNENRSLGEDEEIGREIDVKREPGSEDEEELGIDWAMAHEINRLDLNERKSSEVPEEIKVQGARITIDKGGSSVSSDSSSQDSLLAALEEDEDEEYEEERPKKSRGKSSKKAEEKEKDVEEPSSEVAAEVSSPSSDESDSSILSEGRLALKNLTADSSESDDDDWEPSASRAARLAAKPKRALRTQTRATAAITHTTTTTTTTTISPLTQYQNYTVTSPTTTTSTASPLPPTNFSTSSVIGEEEETVETPQNIEVSETSAGSEVPRSEQESLPLQWMLHQEPFKNAQRRLDSSRIRRAFTVGKFL